MRLLNTDTLEIELFSYGKIPEYAILSHRWGTYELNLQDVESRIWRKTEFGKDRRKVDALDKIKQCCSRAKADSFHYAWIDSCCIDKTSSAELSEAINSMYLWYYKAERCYAYLADVPSKSMFEQSEWFARGWTLQELLAPSDIRFLDKDWNDLGTKESLQQEISRRTRIPIDILSGTDLETASIAQRMSWASSRETTRVEDRAYCLMGIFNINMPLLYGEGERAFLRLQEEIMKISDDHSLFAWKSFDARGGLLATSPDAFFDSNNIIPSDPFGNPGIPITTSSRGVHLELCFMGIGPGGLGMAILNCMERGSGNKSLAIYVRDVALTMVRFERVWCESIEWLDLHKFQACQYPTRKLCVRVGRLAPTSKHGGSGGQRKVTGQIYDDATIAKLMNPANSAKIFHAAREGDQDIVWLLLTRGDVNVNSQDNEGTVLHIAASCRHEALVRTLLARSDIDVDGGNTGLRTPLSYAAEVGHEAIVKLLLQKGAEISSGNRWGPTPLSWAAMRGHRAIMELLLEKGASIHLRDGDRRTPISRVAEKGNESITKLLIENGAETDIRDNTGRTPLSYAAEGGHEAIVKQLLEKHVDIDSGDSFRRTPLSRAAARGHEAIVNLLLMQGASAEAVPEDSSERTPLFYAAEGGHEEVVKLLLENGAKISRKDVNKQTPLFRAAAGGHEAVIKLLLENGAGNDIRDGNGRTPLSWAAEGGHESSVKLLAEKGTTVDVEDDRWGRTPLSWAAEGGHEAVVKFLLEKDAKIDARDLDGRTPLSWAAKGGHEAVIRILVENSANVDATDKKWGRTPLSWVAQRGLEAVIKLLVDNGAENDSRDGGGRTPLSWAAEGGHVAVIELLLEMGVNINTKDDILGQTPLKWATKGNHEAAVKLLRQHHG